MSRDATGRFVARARFILVHQEYHHLAAGAERAGWQEVGSEDVEVLAFLPEAMVIARADGTIIRHAYGPQKVWERSAYDAPQSIVRRVRP